MYPNFTRVIHTPRFSCIRTTRANAVFAVEMKGIDNRVLPGVANVGHRPTLGGSRDQLEVHLFDFATDIYSQRLTVTFRHKIRDEQKFDSIDLLRAQIDRDCVAARDYFATA